MLSFLEMASRNHAQHLLLPLDLGTATTQKPLNETKCEELLPLVGTEAWQRSSLENAPEKGGSGAGAQGVLSALLTSWKSTERKCFLSTKPNLAIMEGLCRSLPQVPPIGTKSAKQMAEAAEANFRPRSPLQGYPRP